MLYHIYLHLYSDMATYKLHSNDAKRSFTCSEYHSLLFILGICETHTRYRVHSKHDKKTVGPTFQRVLAVCQRYSTPKFCKSCEALVIYVVVSFTALLNKNRGTTYVILMVPPFF